MQTALVFTPDARFFRPALRSAGWALAQPDSARFEVVIACEPADVPADWHLLPKSLTSRITLITADFARLTRGATASGPYSAANFRRLFLHHVLPDRFTRFMPMDADMFVAGPGLGHLAGLDLQGHVLAASLDMIRLMDLKGGQLAARFRAYRQALGLALDAPYFNNGLTLIDRAAFAQGEWGERALDFLRRYPALCPYLEQSALNHLLAGRFGLVSNRANFMGDFLALDLEAELRPFIYHFVNSPKPWQSGYTNARFAALYAGDDLIPQALRLAPAIPGPVDRAFRARLLAFLSTRRFLDQSWAPSTPRKLSTSSAVL